MMPPYSRLIQIIGKGSDERVLLKQMMLLARELGAHALTHSFQVLGPAPNLVSKAQGAFYWNLYVKGPHLDKMTSVVRDVLGIFKRGGIQLTADVDPQ